jgi:hypothetical protein
MRHRSSHSTVGLLLIAGGFLLLVGSVPSSRRASNELQPLHPVSQSHESVAGYDHPTLSVPRFEELAADLRAKRLRLDLRTQLIHESSAGSERHQNHEAELIAELNDLVFQVIRHSDRLAIRWTDNWLQRGLAIVYEPLREPQLPEQILSQQQGLCSDACKVLQSQLHEAGFESAFLGLGQHVVLLVRCDDQLYWSDPDFGVFTVADSTTGCPDEELALDQLRARGFPESVCRTYRFILEEHPQWVRLPWNQPLSPRLTTVAIFAQRLTQLAPIACIVIGLLAVWRHRNFTLRP